MSFHKHPCPDCGKKDECFGAHCTKTTRACGPCKAAKALRGYVRASEKNGGARFDVRRTTMLVMDANGKQVDEVKLDTSQPYIRHVTDPNGSQALFVTDFPVEVGYDILDGNITAICTLCGYGARLPRGVFLDFHPGSRDIALLHRTWCDGAAAPLSLTDAQATKVLEELAKAGIGDAAGKVPLPKAPPSLQEKVAAAADRAENNPVTHLGSQITPPGFRSTKPRPKPAVPSPAVPAPRPARVRGKRAFED